MEGVENNPFESDDEQDTEDQQDVESSSSAVAAPVAAPAAGTFTPDTLRATKSKDEAINLAAAHFGVPAATLKGVWSNESTQGKDPKAFAPQADNTSLGDFQILAGTAAGVTKQTGVPINRMDFHDSLYAAGYLLHQNMQAFNGDIDLATAAFNQGPANARSAAGLAYAAKANGGSVRADLLASIPQHEVPEDEVSRTNVANNRQAFALLFKSNLGPDAIDNIAPHDIANSLKKQVVPKTYLPKSVVSAQQLASANVAQTAQANGATTTPTEAMDFVKSNIAGATEPQQRSVLTAGVPGPTPIAFQQTEAAQDDQYASDADRKQLNDNTSALEAFEDGFKQNNIVMRVGQALADQSARSEGWDGQWKYSKAQDDEFRNAGFTETELDKLRDSTSADDLSRNVAQVQDQRTHDENNAQHGVAGFAGGMAGGIADPAAFLLTGGIGATVESLGVVARAGTLTRAAVRLGEGAAGNLAVTGALQAAGSNVTSGDYLMAGLTGAAMGLGFHALGAGGQGALDSLRRGVAQEKLDLHIQAARELGPGASPEAIAQRANDLDQSNWAATDAARRSILLADIPDNNKILPANLFDSSEGAQAPKSEAFLGDKVISTREVSPAVPAQPEVLFKSGPRKGTVKKAAVAEQPAVTEDVTALDDVTKRYGLDNIVEDGQRKIVAEQILRAERDDKLNPIDPNKIDRFLAKVTGPLREQLETYGMTLARSPNPIARFVSRNLMESAAGTAERVRTASITKTQLENISREEWGGYNQAFDSYLKQQPGIAAHWNEATQGTVRRDFDAQIQAEVYRRRYSAKDTDASQNLHPAVKQGVDAWERAMQTHLNWAKESRILGHEGLPATSRGYAPQQLSGNAILHSNPEVTKALIGEIDRQLRGGDNEIDAALSMRLAKEYVEHARARSTSTVERPDHLTSSDMAPNIEEALQRLGIAGDKQAQKLLDRYQRGGAGFTKARYEFDLNQNFKVGEGQANLGDFFERDLSKLYKRYSDRMTGEVALTQYGVYGKLGMQSLRDSMIQAAKGSENTTLARDLKALDDFSADMFGLPVAEMNAGMRAVGNIRKIASMSMLGGMGFTQAAELANVATTLGVTAALKSVPLVRQMFREARLADKAGIFDTIELIGGKHAATEKWHMPFETEDGDTRVYGHDTPGLVTRAISTASRKFRAVTGHQMVHNYQMRMATEQIASKVLRAANGDGKLSKLVSEMGFSKDFIGNLKAELPNIAKFEGKWVSALDISKAERPDVMAEFVQGVQRGAKQVIQGSFRGEGMKSQTTMLGQLLTQFRNFSFLAMEKQWARTAGTVGIPVATAMMAGQMLLSIPVHLARVHLNAAGMNDTKKKQYLDNNLSPLALARASMNYAGLTGLMGDSLDVPMGIYQEASGKSATSNENVRTGAWGVGKVVPAVSAIDSATRAATGVLKKPTFANAVKLGKQVLPGGNMPYTAFAWNMATQ